MDNAHGNPGTPHDSAWSTQVVLEHTYELLRRFSRWPTWAELDDELDRNAHVTDPWGALRDIDLALMWGVSSYEPQDSQAIALTIAGLLRVAAAGEDMRILGDTILWAVTEAQSRAIGNELTITPDTVVAHADVPASGRTDLLQRQEALWSTLGRLWTRMSTHTETGAWEVELARKQLRPLREAIDTDDLLHLLAMPAVPADHAKSSPTAGTTRVSAQASATSAAPQPDEQSSLDDDTATDVEWAADSGRIYTVHRSVVIGRGSQGTVYAGTGPDGAPVAVKVATLRGYTVDTWYRDGRHVLRESVASAHVAAAEASDAVVPMLDELLDNTQLVFFYPRAEYSLDALITARHHEPATPPTPSLQQRIEDEGPTRGRPVPPRPTIEQIHQVAIELASALVQLHLHGVMHRDIKPGNALLWNGRWHWADLGIARILEKATETFTFPMEGTVEYKAPEVLASEEQTVRSDVYSLGCTLYELVTGTLPFPHDPARAHRFDAPDLDAIIDPTLRRAIGAALAKDPASRPTAENLVEMLTEPTISLGKFEGLRGFAERARRERDQQHLARVHATRRGRAYESAKAQFDRIWTNAYAKTRGIEPNAKVTNDQISRATISLFGVELLAIYAEPSDGRCPAVAIGILTVVRGHSDSFRVANIYATSRSIDHHTNVDEGGGAGQVDDLATGTDDPDGITWRLVRLEPSYLDTGQLRPAHARPAVDFNDLERWLIDQAVGEKPAFVVVSDDELNSESLVHLLDREFGQLDH